MTTEKKTDEFFKSIQSGEAGEPFFTMEAHRSSLSQVGVKADCSKIKDGYEQLQVILALQQLAAQLIGEMVATEAHIRAQSPISISDEPAGNG